MDSGVKPRGARERSPDERGGDDRCTGERGAERAMDQHLKTLGLHRKRIAKDGSCLFRAVAEQVLHCQSLHTKVRADCVKFLKQNREIYEAFIEGDFEEYLFKLQDPQQWVGEVEINALAVMYKRDFLIFQEPGKNAVNITDNNFKDKVQLCFLNGNHYDSVYPISHIKNAAVCQSILYELLYDGVFNVERGALTVTQRCSRPNDFLSDDVMNPCDSSDESDAGAGDGNWVETETNTTAPRFNNQSYRGRGRGRSLPERVRRSLNPTLLRNIEYDVWQKTKRAQQKMDYCIAAGMQFTAGDRCQVRIEGTGRSYNATIKEVPPNGLVTVYSEELGKRQVNLWCLRPPPPPNDETSWSTVVNRDKRLSNGHGDWEERGRGRGRRKDLSGPISAVSTVTGSGGRVQKQHSWPPQATVDEQKPARKSSSSIEAVLEMSEEEQILRSVALAEMLNDENSFPALGSQSGMQGDGGKKKRSLGSKTKSPVEDLVRAVSPSGGDRPKSSTPPLTPISTPAAAAISTPPTSNAPTANSPNATNTSEPTPKYPDSNHSFLGSIKATIPHANPTHANVTSISSPTLPAAAPMAKSNAPWHALPTESRQYSQVVVSPSHINASLPLQTHTNSNPTLVSATATISSPAISSAAQVAKSSAPSHTLTTEASQSPHVVAMGGKSSVAPQSVPSSATLISQLPPVLPAPTFIAPIAPSLPRHSPSPPLFPSSSSSSSSSSLVQQTAQTNEAPQATPTNALPTIGGSQTVLQSFHTQHQSQAPSPMSHTPSPVPLTLATATPSDTLPHHPSMPSLPQNLSQIALSQPTITQNENHHQTIPYSTQNQAPVPHTQSQTLATLTQGGPQSLPSLPQNLTQITQYDPHHHHQNHHSQPQNQASFPHMHQTAEAPTPGSLQLHQSNLSHMQNQQQQQNQNQHSELATSPQAINPASLAQYHHQYMPHTQATYPQATQGSTHYPNPQMMQPPHPSQVPHPSASLSISPNQQQLSQSPHIQTETHTEANMNMPPSTHAHSLSMQTHTQTPQIQAQTHTQTPQSQAQNQAHSLTMEMHQTQNQNQAHSLSMQTGQSQSQTQTQSQQAQMQPQSIPGVVPLQQLSQLYTDPLYPGFPTQEKGDLTPAMTPPMSANATGCDLPQDISILRFFFNLGVKAYSMPMCPPYIYLFPLQQAYSMHPRLPSRSPSPPPQYNPPNPPNPVPTRAPESYQHPHPYAQTSTSMAPPYEHQMQMTTTAMAAQSINPYELQSPQVSAADPLHSNHPGYPPAITQPPPHQRMQPWQHQQQQHSIAPQQPQNNRNPSSNFQSVMGYNVVPSPSPPYGVSQAINQGAGGGGGYHQSHSPQGHSMYPQYPQNSHSSLGYQTAATPEDIHGGAAMEQAVNNRAMMGSNPDIKTLHHHPHAVSMATMKPPSNSSSPGSPSVAKTTTTTITTTGNFPSNDPNNIPQPQPHHGYQQRNHQYPQQQYYQATTPSYGLIDPSHGALSVGCSTEDDLEEMAAGIRPITGSANRGPRRSYRGGPVSSRQARQAHEQGRGQQRRRGGQTEGQQGQPGAGNYIQFNSSYRGRGR